MNYNIKWVTEEEYARLLDEATKIVHPSDYDMTRMGFEALILWDEHSSQPVLVRVATHSLIKELL